MSDYTMQTRRLSGWGVSSVVNVFTRTGHDNDSVTCYKVTAAAQRARFRVLKLYALRLMQRFRLRYRHAVTGKEGTNMFSFSRAFDANIDSPAKQD